MDRLNKIKAHLTLINQPISQVIKPQLKQVQVYEKYLHSYETRTSQQIKQTTDHIYQISNKNLTRLQSQPAKQSPIYDNKKYQNCIFICLHGLPPFNDEFKSLNLPGKAFSVIPKGFQPEKDEAFRQQNLPNCRYSNSARQIHEIIQNNSGKEIVFVYHSFGTYMLSVYFHIYGVQKRIKGLIQLGAAPVRQYLYLTEVTNYCLGFTEEDLFRRNHNDVADQKLKQLMDRMNKQLGVKWDFFPSVTYAASFLSYFKSPQCPILFDLNRRYPSVLKLMIFGKDDKLFEQDLLCQRAHFYSKQKLNNETELKQKCKKLAESATQNIQQNFIFVLPKAKHSLHMQKRNQPIIAKSVHQYLEIIFA